jgi:hypothetical protein
MRQQEKARERASRKMTNKLAVQAGLCYKITLIFLKQVVIKDQIIKGGTNV